MKNQKLKLFHNLKQEAGILETYIKQKAHPEKTLQILEAGCGQKWPLHLNEVKHKIYGVDVDEDALKIRKNVAKDLDEIMVGDLRDINLEQNKYDVIYSSFVLEHIKNAEQVLQNFVKWAAPGGLIIIRVPDRNTVYGFITRITPYRVHVLYKKFVEGKANAGKPGFGPYPTVHDVIISRSGLRSFCKKYNLMIKEEYGHGFYYKKGKGIFPLLKRLFVYGVYGISLGNLGFRYNNLTYVLEKSS